MSRKTRRVNGIRNLWGLLPGRGTSPARQGSPGRRLFIEPLERRRLLAVGSGHIYVQADSSYAGSMVAVPNAVVDITVPIAGGQKLFVATTNRAGSAERDRQLHRAGGGHDCRNRALRDALPNPLLHSQPGGARPKQLSGPIQFHPHQHPD